MRRPLRRGFTTLEALVGLAVAPLVAGAIAAGALSPSASAPLLLGAEPTDPAARALRAVAEAHLRATGRCPTAEELVSAERLPEVPLDRWGEAFWFVCQEGRVTALSDGPDGAPFTADDVGDPRPPWRPARRRAW